MLNNIDLIDILNKTGYKIIFKLHPNFFKFIHLFENYNKNIIFDYSSRYVDLFNDSSLLITDYSSVAFDFAYIKKPVLYYQYSDDYNFKERYFDYHTLGFGDVVNNENDLIISIKKLLNNYIPLR